MSDFTLSSGQTVKRRMAKGTNPNPMRVATKHKRVAYGKELLAKAIERRKRRPARPSKPTYGDRRARGAVAVFAFDEGRSIGRQP